MQQQHSTGLAGSHSNVYRLPNAPDVLRSRKPRNRFRTWLEKFCATAPLPPWRICSIPCWFRIFERCIKQQSPPMRIERVFYYLKYLLTALAVLFTPKGVAAIARTQFERCATTVSNRLPVNQSVLTSASYNVGYILKLSCKGKAIGIESLEREKPPLRWLLLKQWRRAFTFTGSITFAFAVTNNQPNEPFRRHTIIVLPVISYLTETSVTSRSYTLKHYWQPSNRVPGDPAHV